MSKRLLHLFLSLALLALATPGIAGLPASVAQAMRAAGLPPDAVAIFAQRVDEPRPLLAQSADQPMNPASTMKLLTSYAGLELLGPAFTWRTEAFASAPLKGDVLDGDLILKGYGDPALTLDSFWNLVRFLRQSGLREIRGDLVLDRSYFASADYDAAAFDGEPYRAYNAGPDALLVNFNATRFNFVGDVAANRVRISADPAQPQLRIDNQLSLSKVPCADWKDRLGYHVERQAGQVVVSFDGHYSLACGEKSLELSVLDDTAYVSQLFRQLWQEQGGTLTGGTRSGNVPEGAVRLAQASSPPLADVIRLMNKYSNNVMAKQLLMTLGAETSGMPGSSVGGAQAVRSWLSAKGMDFPELVIDNGAGLSRNARISARHLGELLLAAYRSPVMSELMSSLPIVAVDGTLQRRMRDSVLAGQGHFKTGSLDDVRALAGYLLDAKGRRWVVVYIANHPQAGGSKAVQDTLLEWLYRHD